MPQKQKPKPRLYAIGSSQQGGQRPKARPRRRSTQQKSGGDSHEMRMTQVTAPVTQASVQRNRFGGISDMRDLHLNYVTGFAYIGNQTLGVGEQVYYLDPTMTKVCTTFVPVAPNDPLVGQEYINDIFKHFARAVYKNVDVRIAPYKDGSASTSPTSIVLAPHRGGEAFPIFKTDTSPPISTPLLMGAKDAQQFPSWLGAGLNLAKYIAGGSGSRQNEMNINGSEAGSSTSVALDSLEHPCSFAIAGNSLSTQNGKTVGTVVVDCVVDLLDFLGGFIDSSTVTRSQQAWQDRRDREKYGRAAALWQEDRDSKNKRAQPEKVCAYVPSSSTSAQTALSSAQAESFELVHNYVPSTYAAAASPCDSRAQAQRQTIQVSR